MTAKVIDGKLLAADVRARVKKRADVFAAEHGRKPGLEVVLVGEDPASQVYVRNKERAAKEASIRGALHTLPTETTEERLLSLVSLLNADDAVDGILVQLPLPKKIDAQRVLDAIDPRKDVDGLHPVNAGLLAVGRSALRPCTPLGCMALLESIGFDLTGKRAVVVGRSNLVGKPLALMLLEKHATVTIAHSRTPNLDEVVGQADVVIAAAGKESLVRGAWIKPGAVVLDVGTNRNASGKLAGDVEYGVAVERAGFITPVPGGVGPMTIAMLLSNTVDAAEARTILPK